MMNIDRFLSTYVRSMRLHYAFISGISGWIGLAFYSFLFPNHTNLFRSFVILSLLFFSWGINQVINDYLTITQDRSKAPNHPLATGELPGRLVLLVTLFSILLAFAAAYRLNPLAILPILAGLSFNILHALTKQYPLLSKCIFSLMLAMCPIFGFFAAGPTPDTLITAQHLAVLAVVMGINAIMAYYVDANKYHSDRGEGKGIPAEQKSITRAQHFALLLATFSLILTAVFIRSNMTPLKDLLFLPEFLFISGIALFLQYWTAFLSFCHAEKTKIKKLGSLVINIRAWAAANCALLAMFDTRMALFLLTTSYILIGFFFTLYQDECT